MSFFPGILPLARLPLLAVSTKQCRSHLLCLCCLHSIYYHFGWLILRAIVSLIDLSSPTMSQELTLKEVSGHNTKKDLYMVIHDKVYDCTSFVDEHPYVLHLVH